MVKFRDGPLTGHLCEYITSSTNWKGVNCMVLSHILFGVIIYI